MPAVISPYVLAKIGRSAARELFLTGRRFSAQHAQEVGLVHAVVPSAQLDATIDGVLREVLAAGPQAVAAAKRLRVGINGVDRGHPSQRGDELRGAAAARVSRL